MGKVAFVFPGQGAQYVGMGEDIANQYIEAKEVFKSANEALGYKISEICFKGPEEKLKKTVHTQPAILTTSIACYKVLQNHNILPDFVAGHSLGEYSAIVAANGIDFNDAVKIVEKRGTYMEEAVPDGKGAMAAILGLDSEKVNEVIEDISGYGIIELANINCPGQVVVAGEKEATDLLIEKVIEKGAKKAIPLKVSGPFHSSLMLSAANKLEIDLNKTKFSNVNIPIAINYTGEIISDIDKIKIGLKKQVYNSVLWDKSIRNLIKNGVNIFIEIGPGKVLSGLIKKIDRNVKIYNVENIKSLNNTLDSMEAK
jgi:[acyl-carrier-protein] S-malonyltransferase